MPDLVNDLAEELGRPALGRLEAGLVIEAGFVGRLCMNTNYRGGIVLDAAVVEREADGAFERVAAMLSGVPHAPS